VAVARANLNYLLAQADSLYVCYHLPSAPLECTASRVRQIIEGPTTPMDRYSSRADSGIRPACNCSHRSTHRPCAGERDTR
jgi:hypothetical protein